jgi:hypothetical protein
MMLLLLLLLRLYSPTVTIADTTACCFNHAGISSITARVAVAATIAGI